MTCKKLCALIAVALTALPAVAYDFEVGGIYYSTTNTSSMNVSVTWGDKPYTGSITIPKTVNHSGGTYTVTSIGYNAFKNCKSLESVVIGDEVKTIEESAFSGCDDLTTVKIGAKVVKMERYAFSGCYKLKNINWSNNITTYEYEVFYGCTALTHAELSASLTSMSNSVFEGCTGITTLTINDGCKVIGGNAFKGCTKLQSVNIPNSVTTLGYEAFANCTDLASATIGNGVKTIEESAFAGCTNLKNVIIGVKVEELERYAFNNCSALESISITSEVVPSTGYEAFNYFNATLYVPSELLSQYQTTLLWSKFMEIKTLENNGVETPNCYGRRGDFAILNILLQNVDEFTSFQFDVTLPAGVTLNASALSYRRAEDHMWSFYPTGNNQYHVTALSPSSATFSGVSGELISLYLAIDPEMGIGNYSVEVKNFVMGFPGGNTNNIGGCSSIIAVEPAYIEGDMDGDEIITVGDITKLIDKYLGE